MDHIAAYLVGPVLSSQEAPKYGSQCLLRGSTKTRKWSCLADGEMVKEKVDEEAEVVEVESSSGRHRSCIGKY